MEAHKLAVAGTGKGRGVPIECGCLLPHSPWQSSKVAVYTPGDQITGGSASGSP
jgi:hypothetical protein